MFKKYLSCEFRPYVYSFGFQFGFEDPLFVMPFSHDELSMIGLLKMFFGSDIWEQSLMSVTQKLKELLLERSLLDKRE